MNGAEWKKVLVALVILHSMAFNVFMAANNLAHKQKVHGRLLAKELTLEINPSPSWSTVLEQRHQKVWEKPEIKRTEWFCHSIPYDGKGNQMEMLSQCWEQM